MNIPSGHHYFPALPLGHGVHQSFTGCHWSPLPLLHDDIMELVMLETLRSSTFRMRMPHRCSIGLGLESCLASPSSLPSASLARQWSSWRCVWGRYVGILPCGPVSEGRGSCSASICHSTCWHSWFPQFYTVIQAVHSLLYIVAKCHFFSVVTWKDIKYLQKCEGCTHFCAILYIYIVILKGNFLKQQMAKTNNHKVKNN